jgi:hypothetical protein
MTAEGFFHHAHEVYLLKEDRTEKEWFGTFPNPELAGVWASMLVDRGVDPDFIEVVPV